MLYHYIKYLVLFSLILSGCSPKPPAYNPIKSSKAMHNATMRAYKVGGKWYYPSSVSVGEKFRGIASWYGDDFHGKKTSNGEYYNMYNNTAAHKTLPMNTLVKVTNLNNNKSIQTRINDRGPFVTNRIIDLSYKGARDIGMIAQGTAPVEVEVIGFLGKNMQKTRQNKIEGGRFLVQIGAFARIEGAKIYQKRYNNYANRYKTIIKQNYQNHSYLNRVYLSGFLSENEARDFIQQGNFKGAFIIRE